MKLSILFLVLTTVLAAPHDHEWIKFKHQFGKEYTSAEEENFRHQIFLKNVEKITQHNERAKNGKVSYTLGVNKFADLTSKEFSKTHFGYIKKGETSAPHRHMRGSLAALPTSVDWRTKGIVTRVKDQGQCGSCWAFSAVASMESAHAQATGNLIELSEQDLVDCAWPEGSYGCEGGLMDSAFNYTIVNGGIDTEASYPYVGEDEECDFKNKSVGLTIKSYTDIAQGDESALVDAVAQRVVSVAIDADNLQLYSGGIYSKACEAPVELDHGVTIVGYGTQDDQDFWIVKNSWGSDWGEKGYVRFARGQNLCGIADDASYPVV